MGKKRREKKKKLALGFELTLQQKEAASEKLIASTSTLFCPQLISLANNKEKNKIWYAYVSGYR